MSDGALRQRLARTVAECLQGHSVFPPQRDNLLDTGIAVADWIQASRAGKCIVIGMAGAQGSGKSTLTRLVAAALAEGYGLRVAALSLDDLYLTREQRAGLAATIHPLLVTRGVPGTHVTELGIHLVDALRSADSTSRIELPSFDKALDDRRPASECQVFHGCADIVLLEGWCVGARPQADADLKQPINSLESLEDPDAIWRRFVNTRLATDYAALFSRLDHLIMLKVPDMNCVYRWRTEQESALAAATPQRSGSAIMDDSKLRRFIMHFERLTRVMLEEMPHRADRTLYLDQQHRFIEIGGN